ncbi:MAG TPA: HAMP domain-containing sensor histidine kinase [Anaerolineales bacterium]|nr:HAMP domain-containing sensor histidine kinase [Anaerolineales bacterium]
MRIVDALLTIKPNWLTKISHRLARGEGVRESFERQLERFFELLLQAVETGDPEWLDPVLDDCVEARTQTDLESRENSLPPILGIILQLTFEVASQDLDAQEALALTSALLPVYTHAFEYTMRKETGLHIEHVAHDLEKAKDSLERLDRSKSDFIAIAAHELKTPLTLIEGYSAMLGDRLPKAEKQGPIVQLMQGIGNGTQRLREIVDDMIDVSMIDNNLLSLHFQPVWINRLFNVLENEFMRVVRDRNQTLIIEPFEGSNEMTFGDDERLYQALRNLVSNAIKYTPDGGKIVIDGRKLPGFLEITITDTGIGVDPDDHARIFEKFGRLGSVKTHSSGKTKFKGGGPGLGLPITKGIIEAHGGAIWLESEGYDEQRCPGSIFHVLLPLRKEPPDDKTGRLFRPLVEHEKFDGSGENPPPPERKENV